ncbi:hypothetical protein [Streptomyces noursei]|uniref:hypothetical protein n=1 Tax=Streptomyces noursei TaxID=1971 RepID=UPI0030F2BC7E
MIEVRGARENNLADVSVDIPKRRLTVFMGVSGSGKSSLVFGTVAAESQRLINETYTAFVQSRLDRLVDDGNTVIVIEHHQAVMAHADWIIDLGPGAGDDGGRVVFAGTPRDLVENGTSLTARHLREYLGAAPGH